MPHGPDAYGPTPHNMTFSPRGEPAIFATMRHDDSPAVQMLSASRPSVDSLDLAYERLTTTHGPAMTLLARGLDAGFGNYGQPFRSNANWDPFGRLQSSYTIYLMISQPPMTGGDGLFAPTGTQKSGGQVSSPLVSLPAMAPQVPSSPPGGKVAAAIQGHEPPAGGPNLSVLLSNNSISLSSAAAAIPTAAQILSRDYESAAYFTTGTVDVAFQSYASRLLLVANSSGDRSFVVRPGDATIVPTDPLSGFLQPSEFDLEADAVSLAEETVRHEREAVDAVLEELHDFHELADGAIPWISDPADATNALELRLLPTNQPFDNIALDSPQGGMVMLVATGDPNISDFATTDSDETVDLLQMRVGVDAAAEFFQAVDAGSEPVPATNLPGAEPTTKFDRSASSNNRNSTTTESKPNERASTAFGAATFVGAMLCVIRRNKSAPDDESHPTAAQSPAARTAE
jgi:hypothetical protein